MEQPVEKCYTYADILSWDEDVRAEIIDGELYMMAEPSTDHQIVSGELFGQIWTFLRDKPCQVFHAPFGVRLFEQEGDTHDKVDTVVEPDIVVICDKKKIDKRGCKGAPDLVIEILSPSNERHDRLVKFNLYQRAKVREYWIVNPQSGTVEVMLPDENGKLTISEVYSRKDTAPVTVLPGCIIDLTKVFPEPED